MAKVVSAICEWRRRAAFRKHRPDVARFGRAMRASAGALANLLFPPHCFLCGLELVDAERPFCHQCYRSLVDSSTSPCPRCAKPVPPHTRADVKGCLFCAGKRFFFQRAMALGTYGGAIRDLVLRMKQARHESLSLAAGILLAERIGPALHDNPADLVTSVPMHWLRRLSRGVNNAELLAEVLAARLHVPLRARLLRCRRKTRKQGTLTPAERLANVRGAYAAARRTNLGGIHVLVVDDVMTTGATANEIAKVLRRRGAREVSIAVVARGVGFD